MKSPDEVIDILERAKMTFAERAEIYGDNWKHHGEFLAALFPKGVTLETADDFNRFISINNVAMKLYRYTSAGGHKDSAHDIIVYAAMLEFLTKEGK